MLVPLSWLREFVPVEAEPDRLAERLSLTGLAVEQVIRMGGSLSGVVVGEVRAVREHPNADSLVLVVASDGSVEHDIVCGARNFAAGDRVPLALPGARLPNGMEIGARVVRGEASNGMLCSAKELGLGEDHTGILQLDADAPLGKDLGAVLEIDDVVLDIDVTPNRPDALSVVGIAREVAALYGLPLTVPEPELPSARQDAGASVTIRDTRGCPRYLARVIRGLRHGRSPWWLRRRLLAAGMRPISIVVDVTNYVMIERGQPLHAFDLATLRDASIVVRQPRKGETLRTLDGVERELVRGDVLICDAESPVAIGGVMGGEATEVRETTEEVLLEAAHFDPVRISRTARRLGLRTEASHRFERGADPEAVPAAAARACELFASLAGGTVAREAIDVYPRPIRRKPIRLRVARASTIIGAPQEAEAMAGWLRAIGCGVTESRSSLKATPPTWRPDITAEEDLIEEVARLYGYDRVPAELPPAGRIGTLSHEQARARRVRRVLTGAGLNEAQTLSLLPPDLPDRLGLPTEHPWRRTARLANPLSEEESVLRPSLIPGLLQAARFNAARQVLPVRLFESGAVFHPEPHGVTEEARVAVVMAGPARADWHGDDRDLDFFDGKGVVEILLAAMGLEASTRAAQAPAPYHPGRYAEIVIGERVAGSIGELHPRAAEAMELPARVVAAELALDPLVEHRPVEAAPDLPRYPAVTRDLALVVPEEVPADRVSATIREAAGSLLEGLSLFDVYRGPPVPDGHVSLAFALAFRDPERTLTDADAEAAMSAVTTAAGAQGWIVRE